MNNCSADVTFLQNSLDSVSAALLVTCVFLGFGKAQPKKGFKCDVPVGRRTKPNSLWFQCQVILSLLLSTFSLIRVLLHLLDHKKNCQDTMGLCLQMFLWPLSLAIVWLEGRMTIQTTGRILPWTLAAFWTLAFASENSVLFNLESKQWQMNNSKSLTDKLEMVLFVLRYVFIFILFLLGLKKLVFEKDDPEAKKGKDDDASCKKLKPFHLFDGKIKMFLPFVWPKGSPLLQSFVFFCMFLLAIGQVLAVWRPICYKNLVDSLASITSDEAPSFRWELVVGYIGLEFLVECLANLRATLWDRVAEYTDRKIEVKLFSHVHRLSVGWHLSKKTGEVLEITSRGSASAKHLIRYLVFTVLPSTADLFIAMLYFITAFNPWFAFILLITVILYTVLTYFVTEWVSKYNKDSTELLLNLSSIRLDSLLNFETVKYFTAEEFEVSRFHKRFIECQDAVWKRCIAHDTLHLLQKFITTGGLLAGSLLCVFLIVNRQGMTMGDYVLFAAYTNQIYSPLYQFGGLYSLMQRSFMEMEKMFEILNEQEVVKDVPQAPDLVVTEGRIEFKNVSFRYKPERPILKNISFVVHPGQTIAFAGPTGSGKSTIGRLLFRFYDVSEGTITIDHQDIAKVTQKSLRCSIGAVPQDTVLFNADVRFNIKFGDVRASDEDMEKAAIAAEIRSAIQSFPKGYDTEVGERGLQLSGGEKQRIAIARTFLKSAPITLLDEVEYFTFAVTNGQLPVDTPFLNITNDIAETVATSCLDTQTERCIQSSLNRLCACKTTIIIAHRLSTIIHAHQICVLKEGQIVERGTHEELMDLDGEYKRMWESQITTSPEIELTPGESKIDVNNVKKARMPIS